MKRYFITYGDARFAEAKSRIVREARATGEFDEVVAFGPEDVSAEVRHGPLWSERRGGGYWTWKPDIILQVLGRAAADDIVVYVDAGCEVACGGEWRRYWHVLKHKELIVQRIYQLNRNWTRQSVRDAFSDVPKTWLDQCLILSGAVFFRKTERTMQFVSCWRKMMLEHPEFVCDVKPSERTCEPPEMVENRHDQTVLSALVYRLLSDPQHSGWIHVQWEHAENLSPFRSQVIRAMRNDTALPVSIARRLKEMALRTAKDLLRKPYFVFRTWLCRA